MRLVHTYGKGYHLFDMHRAISKKASTPDQTRPGLPWPVQLWYCPPSPLTADLEPPAKLPMAYKCLLNGAKAVVLFDTGAKGRAFIEQNYTTTELEMLAVVRYNQSINQNAETSYDARHKPGQA